MTDLRFAVMITSKDRVDWLLRVLEIIGRLDPQPHEILVTADGCTDNTSESIRRLYPHVQLIENSPGLGSVASRANMLKLTTADLVLALDDDSYPEQEDCLKTLGELFMEFPFIGVATFPQRSDEYPQSLEEKKFGQKRPVRSFPNSGACLRVATYRQLPGFEPMFFHMYEEPDYALQCIANGWEVLYFPDITIRHHWTPNQRSELRNHHRHARNECWSTLIRCPFPFVIFFLIYRVFAQMGYATKRGPRWLIREPVWWWQAARGIPKALSRRNPVTWAGYRAWLRLKDPTHP